MVSGGYGCDELIPSLYGHGRECTNLAVTWLNSLSCISQRHPLPHSTVTLPMSEYWVSKKRYFCKYCDVYIADDVPSRQHHENGLRHKGNVERFVRGLYKAGEKRKKDAEEEKREMRRIEQVRFYSFFTPMLV